MNDAISSSKPGFGTRLRRLTDRLDREVQALYRDAGVRFEPRWYAVFVSLREEGPATVGELAQRIEVTHAAVSQVRTALQSAGLIETRPDPKDGRRHTLALSADGEAMALQLQPLWDAINIATARLLAEEAPGLLGGLDDLARALDRAPLKTRVADAT